MNAKIKFRSESKDSTQSIFIEQLPVEISYVTHQSLITESLQDICLIKILHCSANRIFFRQLKQRISKSSYIIARDNETISSIHHHIAYSSHIRSNHGLICGERFNNTYRCSFIQRS